MGKFLSNDEATNWDDNNGCVYKIYTRSVMSEWRGHGWWQIKLVFNIVDPDRKGAAPNKPKDAAYNESQKAYYARKYIEIHAVDTNARVQSEIDEITRRMINFEQHSLVAQNSNENVTSLEE
jgi:hypothetical protein